MKQIKVTPLKGLEDLKFGSTRDAVRKKLGEYKEFKKTKTSKNTVDDFKYCHVFYDEDDNFEAIEIFDATVLINNKKVFPTSLSAVEGIIGKMTKENGSYTNTEKSVGLTIKLGKMNSILFGVKDYYSKSKTPAKPKAKEETPIKEDTDVDTQKLSMDLGSFYDSLKSIANDPKPTSKIFTAGKLNTQPGVAAWKDNCVKECNRLKENCRKHIILDMYCKILPLDDDFIQGNQGQMISDVDSMLASKGMTATQYLQSAADNTKAPLVEFVINATNLIGQQFMEEANEKLKDAKEKDLDIPAPEAPDIEDDPEVSNALVDIKEDPDYGNVIKQVKKATEQEIVRHITELINDSKEAKDMSFDPKPIADIEATTESTLSLGLNYIQSKLLKENVECGKDLQDEMIGLAIRESTLNLMDELFRIPGYQFKEFANRMRHGKGVLINESAATYFIEAAKTEDVDGVVDKAKKEFNDKVNSKLKASDVLENEEEKKKEEENK